MLRKPIFEIENSNNQLNCVNEQQKFSNIKNEEEQLGKDDIKLIEFTNQKKFDIKINESKTKPTNNDDINKNAFQNINLNNCPNYVFFPYNFLTPAFLINFPKEEKEEAKEQNIGKKTKREGNATPHNKFADDNLRKKSKHILLTEILNFINAKLKEIYKESLGNGILLKQLLTLNHKEKANILVEDNKNFLKKTLQEIFSDDISRRYTNYPLDHNKNLINNLLNEENEENKKYFNTLFNLTLSETLEHFQGKKIINELVGLKTYKESLKKYENDKDYHENLLYHLSHFAEIINSKKARQSRKQKNKEKQVQIELKKD